MQGRLESVLLEAMGREQFSERELNMQAMAREREENMLCRDGRCTTTVSDPKTFAMRRFFSFAGKRYTIGGTYHLSDPEQRLFPTESHLAELFATGNYDEAAQFTLDAGGMDGILQIDVELDASTPLISIASAGTTYTELLHSFNRRTFEENRQAFTEALKNYFDQFKKK
jgi:hypothetical protein